MKKLLLLVLLLLTIACTGCVEKKVAVDNAFYSNQSPSITIKFPKNVQFIGEGSGTANKVTSRRYYYADEDKTHAADRLGFIELQSIRSGYYWLPKYLPSGSGPLTSIYTKRINGEDYYCRAFITNANIGVHAKFYKENDITVPDTMDVLVCGKKISDSKKALFAYMRKADFNKFNTIFPPDSINSESFTSEQIHYFNDLDKELSSEIFAKKFEESDLQ